jgi:hypothetical protein
VVPQRNGENHRMITTLGLQVNPLFELVSFSSSRSTYKFLSKMQSLRLSNNESGSALRIAPWSRGPAALGHKLISAPFSRPAQAQHASYFQQFDLKLRRNSSFFLTRDSTPAVWAKFACDAPFAQPHYLALPFAEQQCAWSWGRNVSCASFVLKTFLTRR